MRKTHLLGLAIASLFVAGATCASPLKTKDVVDLWPNAIGPGSEHSPVKLTVTERSKVAYWPDRIVTGITKPNLTAFVPDSYNFV